MHEVGELLAKSGRRERARVGVGRGVGEGGRVREGSETAPKSGANWEAPFGDQASGKGDGRRELPPDPFFALDRFSHAFHARAATYENGCQPMSSSVRRGLMAARRL